MPRRRWRIKEQSANKADLDSSVSIVPTADNPLVSNPLHQHTDIDIQSALVSTSHSQSARNTLENNTDHVTPKPRQIPSSASRSTSTTTSRVLRPSVLPYSDEQWQQMEHPNFIECRPGNRLTIRPTDIPSIPHAFSLEVVRNLDRGSFGRVVECKSIEVTTSSSSTISKERNVETNVAVKIMRPLQKYNQYIGDAELEATKLKGLKLLSQSLDKFDEDEIMGRKDVVSSDRSSAPVQETKHDCAGLHEKNPKSSPNMILKEIQSFLRQYPPRDIKSATEHAKHQCIVDFHDYFTFEFAKKSYFGLVFEQLNGGSLHEFVVNRNASRGMFISDIHHIALQLFRTAVFLHGLGWTHTDFKHKNVMLVHGEVLEMSFNREWPLQVKKPSGEHVAVSVPESGQADGHGSIMSKSKERGKKGKGKGKSGGKKGIEKTIYCRPVSSAIKVIDFGNVTHHNEFHTKPINTRQFRAPEILLELGPSMTPQNLSKGGVSDRETKKSNPAWEPPWDEKSDIWCLACVLLFLYTGDLNFNSHDDLDQLVMMENVCGKVFDAHFYQTTQKKKHFSSSSATAATATGVSSTSSSSSSCLNREKIGLDRLWELGKWSRSLQEQIVKEHDDFRLFLQHLFEFDPDLRPTARLALDHVYLHHKQGKGE